MLNQFDLLDSDVSDNEEDIDVKEILNTTRYYLGVYKHIYKCIEPKWFSTQSNIPNIILYYMGTHKLDNKYNKIDEKTYNIDSIFKASIWHLGNMIYNSNDYKEKIKFKQILDVYILFSNKIKKDKFLELNKNEYIDRKTLLQIYIKSNKKTVIDILPEDALINNNFNKYIIFDRLKQLFNINTVTISSLQLSEYIICKHEEKNSNISQAELNNNWRNQNNTMGIISR
jgi:hypothetical protein